MPRVYEVRVERTTVEAATLRVELPDGLSVDDVDWPATIEERVDEMRDGNLPIDWTLDSEEFDVEGGTEPELLLDE